MIMAYTGSTNDPGHLSRSRGAYRHTNRPLSYTVSHSCGEGRAYSRTKYRPSSCSGHDLDSDACGCGAPAIWVPSQYDWLCIRNALPSRDCFLETSLGMSRHDGPYESDDVMLEVAAMARRRGLVPEGHVLAVEGGQ